MKLKKLALTLTIALVLLGATKVTARTCDDGSCTDTQWSDNSPGEWEMAGRAVLIWIAWIMLGASL